MRTKRSDTVTQKWLEDTGWIHAPFNGNSRWEWDLAFQDHGYGDGTTRHWLTLHAPQDDWWPLDYRQRHDTDDKDQVVGLLTWLERTTVGHVLDVIKVLSRKA